MKLITLDGKPFIRVGSKTLSPIDASTHFAGLVKEAETHLNETGKDRMRVRLAYRHALEVGAPFDRAELAEADKKVQAATELLDAARNELQACRQLLTDHLGRRRMLEAQATVNQILDRYTPPKEAA